MPRPRFQKLSEDKQEAIIHAAGHEFADNGYDGASLNRIIGAAGISKGAFYYYFDDKLDLFATVFKYAEEHMLGAIDFRLEALTADTFWASLVALGHESAEYVRENPWLVGIGKIFYSMPREQWEHGNLGALLADRRHWYEHLIERGQELGVVRTDVSAELLMKLMWAVGETIDRHHMPEFDTFTPEDIEALQDFGIDLMKRLLSPKEVTSP